MTDKQLPAIIKSKNDIELLYESMLDQIEDVRPRHVMPEKILRGAAIAAAKNPKLYQCTRKSWQIALITASEFGLDISGATNEANIIPYSEKGVMQAKYQIGYQGIVVLASQAGNVKSMNCQIVYENDDFNIDYGDPVKPVTHKPALYETRGKIIGAYCVMYLMTGGIQTEWMSLGELENTRRHSKLPDSPAWTDWTGEMYRKTVLKRALKFVTKSPELQRAIEIDNDMYGVAETETRSRTETLKEKMKKRLALNNLPDDVEDVEVVEDAKPKTTTTMTVNTTNMNLPESKKNPPKKTGKEELFEEPQL